MTRSQIETVRQLKSDSWILIGESSQMINGRKHTVVRMTRDGKVALINSRGGFGGLATMLAKN